MSDNDRSVVAFAMLAHAMVHTYEMSIPILMILWAREFPISIGSLAAVVSVGYLLFGIGALPAGILSDSYGSRRPIQLCLAGMGLSFVLVGLAPNVPMLLVALMIWGVAASIYHPSGLSLISKGTVRQGSAFAYHGMAGNAGIALGPLVTALLLLFLDWRTVAMLLSIPAAATILISFRFDFDEVAGVEARGDGSEEIRATGGVSSVSTYVSRTRALFSPAFALVFAIVIMNGLYYRGALTLLPEILSNYLDSYSDLVSAVIGGRFEQELDLSSFLYAGLLLVGIGGQYVGGRLTDRMRTEKALALVFFCLIVIALLFVPAATLGVLPLVAVSVSLGFFLFILQPLYQATIAEYSRPEERGLSYGFTYVGVFGFGALGAAITGVTYETAGMGSVFFVLAIIAVCACLLSGYLLRRYV